MGKDKEGLQQAYLQLQLIENQLNDLQEQVVHVENKKQELLNMNKSLGELDNNKSNVNSFSPLGLGVYVKSKVLDTKNLLVNVGADIFAEKKPAEISKSIKKQIKQFEELSRNLTQNYQMLAVQAQALQAQLHKESGQ